MWLDTKQFGLVPLNLCCVTGATFVASSWSPTPQISGWGLASSLQLSRTSVSPHTWAALEIRQRNDVSNKEETGWFILCSKQWLHSALRKRLALFLSEFLVSGSVLTGFPSPWVLGVEIKQGCLLKIVKQKSACSLILSNLRVPHSPAADYSKVLLLKGQELVSFLVGMQVGTLLVIQHLRVWEMT